MASVSYSFQSYNVMVVKTVSLKLKSKLYVALKKLVEIYLKILYL